MAVLSLLSLKKCGRLMIARYPTEAYLKIFQMLPWKVCFLSSCVN